MQILGPNANTTSPESDILIFEEFLRDPATTIPLNSNFLIVFEAAALPVGIKQFSNAGIRSLEPGNWGIQYFKNLLTGNIEKKYGYKCLFANGVTIPSEKVGDRRVGMQDLYGDQSGGILSGVVSTSREQRQPLSMSILETNTSFIDFVIRPWVIAVSHYGLFARKTDSAFNLKTDIGVYQFDHKTTKTEKIRKKWIFHQAAPTGFDDLSITYGASDTSVIKVNWAYNNYTLGGG